MEWYPLKPDRTGDRYVVVLNGDGRRWVFPFQGLEAGLRIYQPNSNGGRLLKSTLPYLKRFLTIIKTRRVFLQSLSLEEEVKNLLEKWTSGQRSCSAFYALPGPRQKIILQVTENGISTVYVKISRNPQMESVFQRECDLLRQLEKKGLEGIPRGIYCGKVGYGPVFIQSGYKNGKETYTEEFGQLQMGFLTRMYECTKERKAFHETVYARRLEAFDDCLKEFSSRQQRILKNALAKVKSYFAGSEECYLWHGDFTPWNMYIQQGKLFVFDFEYAELEYPKYFDFFHYQVMVLIYAKKISKEEIWQICRQQRQRWEKLMSLSSAAPYFLGYLLEMIGRNKRFEKEYELISAQNEYDTWIYLADRIQQEWNWETEDEWKSES